MSTRGAASRWTPERDRQARALYETDVPLTQVAQELGTNTGRAADAIRRAGGTIRCVNHNGAYWTTERQAHARTLYESGMTLADIAVKMQTSAARVGEAVSRAGGTLRPPGPPHGERNPAWQGGQRVDKGGYILILVPSHPNATKAGYVREHRLVMEATLGRYLTTDEVVHHRNGDTSDNRPENLELFVCNADHLRTELAGRVPNWTPEGRVRISAASSGKVMSPEARAKISAARMGTKLSPEIRARRSAAKGPT